MAFPTCGKCQQGWTSQLPVMGSNDKADGDVGKVSVS